jgi:hypothetical protein
LVYYGLEDENLDPWAEGIRGLMGEKGLVEEDWNDRHNWRKTII